MHLLLQLGDNALMTAAASGNTFIVQAILNHIAYEDKEKLLRQVNDVSMMILKLA